MWVSIGAGCHVKGQQVLKESALRLFIASNLKADKGTKVVSRLMI